MKPNEGPALMRRFDSARKPNTNRAPLSGIPSALGSPENADIAAS
jgi:hypothetical protein